MAGCLCLAIVAVWDGAPASGQDLRIVTWNIQADTGGGVGQIGGVDGGPGLSAVLQAIGSVQLNGNTQPIDVLALEELNGTGNNQYNASNQTLQFITNQLNGIYGTMANPTPYAYDTVTDPTDGAGNTGNGPSGLIYNTLTVKEVGTSVPIGTVGSSGAARAPMRYDLQPVAGNSSDSFYLYVEHAKSGSTSSDMTRRNAEAQEVRTDAAALGPTAHVIYSGDFNVTSSTEASYQTMISPTYIASGNGKAIDPANPANNWTDTTTFRGLMTESAVNVEYRDDFQFTTGPLQSGSGLQSISGSYEVVGNNGSIALHSAVTAAGNTSLSELNAVSPGYQATILQDLTTATDHLPVVADYSFVTTPEPSSWILGLMAAAWLLRHLCGRGRAGHVRRQEV